MKDFKSLFLVILGTVIATIIGHYLIPLLPDGPSALKYVLTGLSFLSTFGISIIIIFLSMKYSEFNKSFVFNMCIGFCSLTYYTLMFNMDKVVNLMDLIHSL